MSPSNWSSTGRQRSGQEVRQVEKAAEGAKGSFGENRLHLVAVANPSERYVPKVQIQVEVKHWRIPSPSNASMTIANCFNVRVNHTAVGGSGAVDRKVY